MRRVILSLCLLVFARNIVAAQQYDLVIEGGRVIDPETGLDGVRNVGVRDGKIVRVSAEALSGRRVIYAGGLVVAPGFIDLHQHGQEMESQRVKALDGVTTALELEIGAPDVAQFLKSKEGHSLIHYGTSASHVAARAAVFGAPLPAEVIGPHAGIPEILPKSGPATDQAATPQQIEAIRARLRTELDAGGLAVGMGIQYTPGATRLEVLGMFRLAAERGLPVYTHVRSAGRVEPGSSIEAVSEVIGAAAITGAALHIVHINSSCLRDSLECLAMVEGARARGLDVTTEAYPYIAGMTAVNSALFNPGWREKLGIDYGDLVLPDTGEHLTRQRFDELHNSNTTQLGADFRQHARSGGQSDSSSAGDDCERRRDGSSPQRWNLLAGVEAVCAREGNGYADGCDPEDEFDAGADAGAVNACGAAERQTAGGMLTRTL